MYGADWPVEETVPTEKKADEETREVPQWGMMGERNAEV